MGATEDVINPATGEVFGQSPLSRVDLLRRLARRLD